MKRLALLLFLAGCASQQSPLPPLDQNIQNLLTNLKAVSIADLQNAEAIAVANNDTLMAPCYPALIQFVQSFAGASGTVSGAFSAFEMARVTRIGLSGGLPDYLKLGCAAGVVDEAMFITRLAGMLGLATALGPIAPVVVPPLAPAPAEPAAPVNPPKPPKLDKPPPKTAVARLVEPTVVPAPDMAKAALAEMAATDFALKVAARSAFR